MSISNAAWDAHENAMPYDNANDCPWCDEPTENFDRRGIAMNCDDCVAHDEADAEEEAEAIARETEDDLRREDEIDAARMDRLRGKGWDDE